jgi:ATP/maltotriose-dependent transcriptional regulator MalT
MQSLPEEIKDVQTNVDTLMKNSKHLDSAVDKINSLNEMLKDTENLIEKVQNDREGLARAEARISDLSKAVDTKFAALKAITDAEIKKKPSSSSSSRGVSPRKRENIRQLKQQGWSNEEIASSLKISLSEVDLVLELPD